MRYYKKGDGLALGPGPFVTALEFATDVKAEVVGKPQASFFRQALSEIGCDVQSAVMIGDVSYLAFTMSQWISINWLLILNFLTMFENILVSSPCGVKSENEPALFSPSNLKYTVVCMLAPRTLLSIFVELSSGWVIVLCSLLIPYYFLINRMQGMTLVEQNPLGSKDFLFKQVHKKIKPFFFNKCL